MAGNAFQEKLNGTKKVKSGDFMKRRRTTTTRTRTPGKKSKCWTLIWNSSSKLARTCCKAEIQQSWWLSRAVFSTWVPPNTSTRLLDPWWLCCEVHWTYDRLRCTILLRFALSDRSLLSDTSVTSSSMQRIPPMSHG